MEITEEQYQQVAHLFPVQRGNVKLSNLQVLNAVLYLAEPGCQWRGLPERYGHWHTIYMRWQRWNQQGALARVFAGLQEIGVLPEHWDVLALDSTSVKVHPDATGAPKKKGPQALGKSHGGRNTKVHGLAADDRTALAVALSPGQAHDGGEGRKLLTWRGPPEQPAYLLMDRAYEGNVTRQLAADLGYWPVAPPRRQRKVKWDYDKDLYRQRNAVERLFGRLKRFRRIFTRYDQLDFMYLGFVLLACIFELLHRPIAQTLKLNGTTSSVEFPIPNSRAIIPPKQTRGRQPLP